MAAKSKDITVSDLAERSLERWDDAELRGLTDYEQAVKQAADLYGGIDDVSKEIGNGFAVLAKDDKARLVGKPFVALFWTFNAGDYGDYFATMFAISPDGAKFIINDGSSGVYAQLRDYSVTHDGRMGGLSVPAGLRASEYPTCKTCGKPRPKNIEVCTNLMNNGTDCNDKSDARDTGRTFYLDTAAQPV